MEKWRRGQDSNLHILSDGGFQDRCTTIMRPLRVGLGNYNARAGTAQLCHKDATHKDATHFDGENQFAPAALIAGGTPAVPANHLNKNRDGFTTRNYGVDYLFQLFGRWVKKAPTRNSELPI